MQFPVSPWVMGLGLCHKAIFLSCAGRSLSAPKAFKPDARCLGFVKAGHPLMDTFAVGKRVVTTTSNRRIRVFAS